MKKVKKKTTSQLKKELDKVFSIYIRQKYEKNGQVQCYTCGKTFHWKEIQNGHFVSRTQLATRYDERNCKPQCVGCNIFGGGRIATFANYLEREEEGIVARLYREAQKIVKDFPYQEKIDFYKEKIKDIE